MRGEGCAVVSEVRHFVLDDADKVIHKAKRQGPKFFVETERGVRNFIIAVVSETYILDLRHAK